MPRILPDINDQIVWQLNESSGNFHNYGQLLPQNALTDLVVTNSIIQTGTGILYANCPQIPGTSNFPVGSSSTRNYASGAKTIVFNSSFTISMWVNLRSYTASNNTSFISKEYRDPSINGNVWSTPFYAITIGTETTNGGGDWGCAVAINSSTQVFFTVTDFPIPLGNWSHLGMTYDGTNLRMYLNGCQCISSGNPTVNTVASTAISYTDGVNGMGPWKIGAITNTGSSNKEETNAQVQDIRIANIVRSLSYFQKIYKNGALPLLSGHANGQFFKLRAYDLGCSTPTPVVWVDTQVSLANAPSFPCSGPYSNPEVLDTWFV